MINLYSKNICCDVFIIPLLLGPYPALIIPLPVSIFPNKLAPNVPNNILRNPPFCSFASF